MGISERWTTLSTLTSLLRPEGPACAHALEQVVVQFAIASLQQTTVLALGVRFLVLGLNSRAHRYSQR